MTASLPVEEPTVRITRLPNGLTVATEVIAHVATATLGLWVGTGSRNERPDEHGLSHLIEHMAFKGTATRSARRIAEDIENVGGEINAATSSEFTSYTARVLAEDVEVALDVLGDILTQIGVRSGGARPREERDPAGIRRRRGHAGRLGQRRLRRDGLRRPGGRAADPRAAGDDPIASRRRRSAPSWAANTRPAAWSSPPPGP